MEKREKSTRRRRWWRRRRRGKLASGRSTSLRPVEMPTREEGREADSEKWPRKTRAENFLARREGLFDEFPNERAGSSNSFHRAGNDSGLIGRMGWGRVFASVNFRQIWGYVFVQLRKFIRTIGRLIDR